jgi:hypothetical protein
MRVGLVAGEDGRREVCSVARRHQPDVPNISEAIRRLVDAGLEATGGNEGCLQTPVHFFASGPGQRSRAPARAFRLLEVGLKAKQND